MNRGFAALTLTLIVSGILLVLVSTSLIESFSFFDQATRKQARYINQFNAKNCLDQALLELAHDYFFTTVTPRHIQHFDCSIISVTQEGDLRHIEARGDLMKAYVYKKALARVLTHNLEILYRED